MIPPQLNIGKKFVVLTEPGDAFGPTISARQTERADAKLHPCLFGMNRRIHRLHQTVDVVTSPVSATELSSRCKVAFPRRLVGKIYVELIGHTFNRVGIEVVVNMYAVHVIATHHITNHIDKPFCAIRFARINPALFAVGFHQLGARVDEMVSGGQRLRGRMPSTIRVQPRVKLKAIGVRLADPQRERIVKRLWRLTLHTRKILRPRLNG